MNNDYDNESVMITEKVAKDYNLTYIQEVAERAGMTDAEVQYELFMRGYKSIGDDEKDTDAVLSVLIDAYKKELMVHELVNKNFN